MAEATIILPPPAIKAIVDKTAAFIAKSNNASMLEEKFRQREKTDSRFAFMTDSDPYHAYYAERLAAFKAGEQPDQKAEEKESAAGQAPEDDGRPPEPPALEFLVEDPPKVNAVDLYVSRPSLQFLLSLTLTAVLQRHPASDGTLHRSVGSQVHVRPRCA